MPINPNFLLNSGSNFCEIKEGNFTTKSTWIIYSSIVNDRELYSECFDIVVNHKRTNTEELAESLEWFFEDVLAERTRKQGLEDALLLYLLAIGFKDVNWLEIASALRIKIGS
jgi:hypothetical protein